MRYGMSRWCRVHRRRNALYGAPTQRGISRRHYAAEYARVSALLDKYADSPNVVASLKFLRDSFLATALAKNPTGAERERARLAYGGAQPMDVLKVGATLFLYSHSNPRTLPDGHELTYAISRGVSALVPHIKKRFVPMKGSVADRIQIGEKARREMGEQLRSVLAIFWRNVIDALDRDDALVKQEAEDLRAPFAIPVREQ